MSQLKGISQDVFSLSHERVNLSILFRPLIDWVRPTHTGVGWGAVGSPLLHLAC